MLTAFQPPRGHRNRHRGIRSILSSLPGRPCGGAPAGLNHRASGIRIPPESRGRNGSPSFAYKAGRTVRAFQRRKPFVSSCRGPLSSPCSILIAVPVSSPFREGFAARECSAPLECFGFPRPMPRFSRRLPSVPVPYRRVRPWFMFLRRAAAAFLTPVVTGACERRAKTGYLYRRDESSSIMKNHEGLLVRGTHEQPCLLSERLAVDGETSASRPGNAL